MILDTESLITTRGAWAGAPLIAIVKTLTAARKVRGGKSLCTKRGSSMKGLLGQNASQE
jgi:hypothetical protein